MATLRSLRKFGFSVAALGVLIVLALFLRLFSMQQHLATRRYEDLYYVPAVQWLPLLSMGYHEALSDLLWMKGLIYFGEELRHKGNVRHIYDYAEAILALDPNFRAVYRWVGMGALYRTGQIRVDDARKAVGFLRRGANRFPQDGDLAWDLGATLRYEVVPLLKSESEKKEAIREALEYMQVAARLGKGPSWLVLSNVGELKRLGKNELAIRHLEEMYTMVKDEDLRQQIALQLEHLRDSSFREALTQVVRTLNQRQHKNLPYVPFDFFLLLDAPTRVDPWANLRNAFNPNGKDDNF